MIRSRSCLALLSLSGCVAVGVAPQTDQNAPTFAPMAFFAGHTEGNGHLRIAMSSTRTVHVTGQGEVGSDGTLILMQRVDQQGAPPRSRTWFLRPTAIGTYEGTLSDAVGPVTATVRGNILHIRYKTAGSVNVEQRLSLQPGGRIAHNHLVARKFGIPVAVLEETIRKIE